MPTQPLTSDEARTLVAFLRVCRGRDDIPVTACEVMCEAERVGLFSMTDAQFDQYRQETYNIVMREYATKNQAKGTEGVTVAPPCGPTGRQRYEA